MKYSTTTHFDREFKNLPKSIRTAFRKQIHFLLVDIRHPSLRAKKYYEAEGVWQARVTDNVRFFFRIESNVYRLLNIRRHTN